MGASYRERHPLHALASLVSHPPSPSYSLLGFRVLPPNPPSKGCYALACGALATTILCVCMFNRLRKSRRGNASRLKTQRGLHRNAKLVVGGTLCDREPNAINIAMRNLSSGVRSAIGSPTRLPSQCETCCRGYDGKSVVEDPLRI